MKFIEVDGKKYDVHTVKQFKLQIAALRQR